MKVESLTQAVCDLALRFGEGGDDNDEVVMVRCLPQAPRGFCALPSLTSLWLRPCVLPESEPALWCRIAHRRNRRERPAAVRFSF